MNRLNSVRLADETDAAFARRLGVPYWTLLHWVRQARGGRDCQPKLETIDKLCESTGLDGVWLLTGKGRPNGSVSEH